MNFERHIDPKESMRIGQVASALHLADVELMNRKAGKGNWWLQRLSADQVIPFLRFLSTSSLRVKDYYGDIFDITFIMEARGNIMPIYNISELKGKTIIYQNTVYHIKKDLDLS